MLWRYGAPRSNGKRPKKPYSPRTFAAASHSDPATWGTFEEALDALASRAGYYAGIGYVFAEDDPYAGVDLDGCRNPTTGEIAAWARTQLGHLAGAYVDISPSDTGVKAIVLAALPGPGRRKGPIELYDRDRFFTITGRALSAPGPIAEAQTAISALYAELGGMDAGEGEARTAADLDWRFVAWLDAHSSRLLSPSGIPYGATPQLRALLERDELPASLAAKGNSASERRALVVRQLARAGHMPEEVYVLSRLLWARYGYERKLLKETLADLLRLLRAEQLDPAKYSPYSLARFADYRSDPHTPPASSPAAPEPAADARRAPCTPDAYLVALRGLDTGAGIIMATRAERAEAAGVGLKTAQRLEARLVAAEVIHIDVYTLSASDGRHTRASRVTLLDRGDVHTEISTIAHNRADVHTGPQEAAEGSTTAQSGDMSGVCIEGENTVLSLLPAPRPAGAAGGRTDTPVFSPSPTALADLVAEGMDAYGHRLKRVESYIRANGDERASSASIARLYRAELERRRRARADAKLRQAAEAMSPTKRRAKLRSLERHIAADLKLAADLRRQPYCLDPITGKPTDVRRSRMTPQALAGRAYMWARQFAIVAQVHDDRTFVSPEAEAAALLADVEATLAEMHQASALAGRKSRATFRPAPAAEGERARGCSPPPAAPAYNSAGLVDRLYALKQRGAAQC